MEEYLYPIVVASDSPLHTAQVQKKLQIYFQSSKKSGGEECKVEFKGGNTATVWFKSEKGRENILQRKNHGIIVDNKEIKLSVSVGQQSEGPCGVCHLHPLSKCYLLFYESGKKVQNDQQDKAEEILLSKTVVLENVTIDKNILEMMVENISKLSEEQFLLQLLSDERKAVITFSDPNHASQFLMSCIKNKHFQQFGLSAKPLDQTRSVKVQNLPADCTEKLKGVLFEMKEDAALEYNKEEGTVTTARLTKDVDRFQPVVERILQTKRTQLKKEEQCVSEEIHLEPTVFYILQQEGIQQHASKKFPELKFTYDAGAKKLVLCGSPDEVLDMRNEVQQRHLEIKEKPVDVEFTLLSFLNDVDNEKMSSEIFSSCNINALYKIENKSLLIVASCDQTLDKAEKQIKEILTTLNINVQDKDILRKPEWLKFETDLLQACNSSRKTVQINYDTESTIVICGLEKQVTAVYEKVSEFINKNTYIEEFVPVQCNAALEFIRVSNSQAWEKYTSRNEIKILFDNKGPRIKLCGGILLVEEVKSLFCKLTASLFTDCLKICKPGAAKHFLEKRNLLATFLIKNHNCVVTLQEDISEVGVEEEEKTTEEENDVEWTCKTMMPNGKIIIVGKGNLCQVATDAVVNAANEYLRHTGGLAGALSFAAGPQLQHGSEEYIKESGPLRPGEATVTKAGRLPCRIVIHAVGPRYRETDSGSAVQLLENAVKESLTAAVQNNCSSIAIPAISSGIFGFPLDLCARTIAKAVREHCENHPGGSGVLNKIYLVNHDDKTVQAMTRAVKNVFAGMQMQVPKRWNQPVSSKSLIEQKPAYERVHRSSRAIVEAENTRTIQGTASTQTEVGETPQESPAFFSSISTPQPGVYTMNIGHVAFTVSSGDVNKEVTDVAVSFEFSTHSGPLPNCGLKVSRSGDQLCRIRVCIQNDATDIKENVLAVLLECDENKINSVTFPALDAGTGGFSPSSIADAMMDAVAEFQTKMKRQHLHTVKVVVFQSHIVEEYYKSMQARENTTLQKLSSSSNIFSTITGAMYSVFNTLIGTKGRANELESGASEAPSRRNGAQTAKGLPGGRGQVTIERKPENRMFDPPVYQSAGKSFTPTVFQFCARSAADVTHAKEVFHDIIKKEQTERSIEDQCIAKFSAKDFVKLNDLESTLTIKIHLEKHPKPLVHLEGLTQDVLTAEKEITEIINGIILAGMVEV
ncbi:poly ADP-ribose polymerase 14-like isoform X1 [Arapaima gigas]